MPDYFGRDGKVYSVADRPTARGGRGRFYPCTNDPSVGVKILDDPAERADCADKGDILSRWVRVPGTVLPLTLVAETPGGPPVGLALPYVEGDPLGVVLNPAARAAANLSLGLRDLVGIAANVADGMAASHDAGLLEGDVNPGNRLVSRSRVGERFPAHRVDVDSSSFRGTTSDGRVCEFTCGVGQQEFTAPEFIGTNFRVTHRGRESDVFGLAVLIWMLVKEGSHPYAWRHLHGGSIPQLPDIMKSGGWPFAPKTPLPPDVQPLDVGVKYQDLPPTIQGLFTRAFAGNPSARPQAAEWAYALTEWEKTIPAQMSVGSATQAARSFLQALHSLVTGSAALRAIGRVLGILGANSPVAATAASSGPPLPQATAGPVAALIVVALALTGTVAAVSLTPSLAPPSSPPLQTPKPPSPGRFDGIPIWQDLDSEIQAERKGKP